MNTKRPTLKTHMAELTIRPRVSLDAVRNFVERPSSPFSSLCHHSGDALAHQIPHKNGITSQPIPLGTKDRQPSKSCAMTKRTNIKVRAAINPAINPKKRKVEGFINFFHIVGQADKFATNQTHSVCTHSVYLGRLEVCQSSPQTHSQKKKSK